MESVYSPSKWTFKIRLGRIDWQGYGKEGQSEVESCFYGRPDWEVFVEVERLVKGDYLMVREKYGRKVLRTFWM